MAPATSRGRLDNEALLRIASLTKQPGWGDLQQLVDALYEEDVARVGRLVLQGEPGDGRDFATRKGYWLGIRQLLREPANALHALEREIARNGGSEGER